MFFFFRNHALIFCWEGYAPNIIILCYLFVLLYRVLFFQRVHLLVTHTTQDSQWFQFILICLRVNFVPLLFKCFPICCVYASSRWPMLSHLFFLLTIFTTLLGLEAFSFVLYSFSILFFDWFLCKLLSILINYWINNCSKIEIIGKFYIENLNT